MPCESGKIGFREKHRALVKAGRAENWHGKPTRVYRCPMCRQWHITTKNVKGRRNETEVGKE